ncbi:MAG: hypothetical protein ABI895_39710, partial [Deltaproteobacteria bacterium]
TQCVGNGQIRRCVNGFFGPPTSCSDGNACNGVESCQNNSCVGGAPPNCNDGNQCTNDSCSPTAGCQFAGFSNNFQCINNGGQVQGCSNGQLQTANCSGLGCTAGRCNNCNQGVCANGTQFQTCDNGQISAPKNCPANNICQGGGNCVFNCQQLNCNDNNACTNDSCSPQTGCVHTNNTLSCSDGNACNGGETCRNGTCQPGTPVTCNDGNPCTTDNNCNRTTGMCSFPATNEGMSCGGSNTCQGGQCRPQPTPTPPARLCNSGSFTACANDNASFTRCNAAGTANNEVVPCPAGLVCNATVQNCAQKECLRAGQVVCVGEPPGPFLMNICNAGLVALAFAPLPTCQSRTRGVRCDPDGTFVEENCTPGNICGFQGHCVPEVACRLNSDCASGRCGGSFCQ